MKLPDAKCLLPALLFASLLAAPTDLTAEAETLHYQGRLTVGAAAHNGSANFKFALYDPAAAKVAWSNDGTTGNFLPIESISINVDNGLFSVSLGSPPMPAIDSNLFGGAPLVLRIWADTGSGMVLLSPDQKLEPVANAHHAETVPAGSITSSKLAPSAVTSATIADGAITSSKLFKGAVQKSHIAPGAITNDHLASAPRSGTILASSMQMSFGTAEFDVTFDPTFATTPIVTLAPSSAVPLYSPPGLWISKRSPSSFSGQLVLAPPPREIVVSNVNAELPSSTGLFASLIEVNGRPAIAYSDFYRIEFARYDGAYWRIYQVASGGGNVIEQPAVHIDSANRPAIAYYDKTAGALMYARASNTSGTAWGTPAPVVTTTNDVGSYVSVTTVNGNPAISFGDRTANLLRFVRASDNAGTTWGTPVTVANANLRGSRLQVVSGHPAIAFTDYGPTTAQYIRSNDPDGDSWGTAVSLGNAYGSSGVSLAVVNGNPAVCYQSRFAKLIFRRATDAEGSSWANAQEIDRNDEVGSFPSLNVINGYPAVSYLDKTHGSLKYVRAKDANGDDWATPVWVVQAEQTAGYYSSLAEIDGQPGIAYQAHENLALEYIRQSEPETTLEVNWIAIEP